MAAPDVDSLTGTQTTGHEWDGIKELNTPLPKWWLYVFYSTILFAVVYCILFPAWPIPGGYTAGLLDWSSRRLHNERLARLEEDRSVWVTEIRNTPLEQIVANPNLLTIATVGGKAVFANNCAPCHGTGGIGRPGGYPTLLDDDWIWGGTLEDIYTTVRHGIRNATDPEARIAEMPAFGADGLLTQPQIAAVADHIIALRGDGPENAEGAAIFAEQCSVCHGDLGKGMPELGAPNLTDQIWLYGGTKAEIVAQITRPRHGVMPPWVGRLSEEQIKQVTVYVHQLGGGQ
jgi:cytochrome c oxidase cbb3-type subunit 3